MINDKAETPVEIGFVILISLIVLMLVELIGGSIVDGFVFALNQVNIALSPWAAGIMSNYVRNMSRLVYAAPVFLAVVIIVWGFRALFRKQQTIRTESGIMIEEE